MKFKHLINILGFLLLNSNFAFSKELRLSVSHLNIGSISDTNFLNLRDDKPEFKVELKMCLKHSSYCDKYKMDRPFDEGIESKKNILIVKYDKSLEDYTLEFKIFEYDYYLKSSLISTKKIDGQDIRSYFFNEVIYSETKYLNVPKEYKFNLKDKKSGFYLGLNMYIEDSYVLRGLNHHIKKQEASYKKAASFFNKTGTRIIFHPSLTSMDIINCIDIIEDDLNFPDAFKEAGVGTLRFIKNESTPSGETTIGSGTHGKLDLTFNLGNVDIDRFPGKITYARSLNDRLERSILGVPKTDYDRSKSDYYFKGSIIATQKSLSDEATFIIKTAKDEGEISYIALSSSTNKDSSDSYGFVLKKEDEKTRFERLDSNTYKITTNSCTGNFCRIHTLEFEDDKVYFINASHQPRAIHFTEKLKNSPVLMNFIKKNNNFLKLDLD